MASWNWLISAATSASILAAVGALFRDTIAKYIAAFVQLRFDERLERLRSDLRRAEETLKRELESGERTIKTLVDTTLALRSNRQSALQARQLLAVERLWETKTELDRFKFASEWMSRIKFEEACKRSKTDEKVRQFFAMGQIASLTEWKPKHNVNAERPFLSSTAWSLFYAYQAVLFLAATKLHFLTTGIGEPELITNRNTDTALKTALPHLAEYIDKYSAAGHHFLLDELEQRLLAAIQEMLEGRAADSDHLRQAAEIQRAANEIGWEPPKEVPASIRADRPPPPTTT
jgi:hypothetical protein